MNKIGIINGKSTKIAKKEIAISKKRSNLTSSDQDIFLSLGDQTLVED